MSRKKKGKMPVKYKARAIHPNSMRPLTKWYFFKTARGVSSFKKEFKEWYVEAFEKIHGKWEWSEKYSING